MSIISVNFLRDEWEDERDGSRTYTRTYHVHSDNPAETMVTVRAALPLNWTADATDAAAIVVRRRARRDEESLLLWHAEVEWHWAPEQEEEDEDPTNEEPKIRWTSRAVLIPVIEDNDGDAVLNSAGDYFDPPPEKEVFRWVANIQFKATAIPSNIRNYAGRKNSADVVVDGEPVAAGRCRVVGLDIGEKETVTLPNDSTVTYRPITVAIEVLDDEEIGFDLHLLDQGYRIKDGDELKDILIEDEDGNMNRPSSPVLLDGNGGKLSDPSPSTAEFLDFDTVFTADLTVFPGVTSS